MRRLSSLFAAGCLLASPALAAHDEHGYWDFRFGFGGEPPIEEAEYETSSGTFEQEWDSGGGSFEFNVAHRFDTAGPSSGYVTFGPFVRGFSGEEDPWTASQAEVSLGTLGLQVGGGYSFRKGRYSLEIGPRLGIGSASATETYYGQELESDSGPYVRWDVGATNALTFRKFQFGATIGVAAWAAEVHYDPQVLTDPLGTYTTQAADATYSGGGGYLLMFVGFR